MVFPVMGINGLGEYMEVGKVIRFNYSGDLILDPICCRADDRVVRLPIGQVQLVD